MNATFSKLYTPTYVEMRHPLTTWEAACRVVELPNSVPNREARKNRTIVRIRKTIQKAIRTYENARLPDAYRLEHGIPAAWDGGLRVVEAVQVDRWKKRRYTKTKRSRAKELELLQAVHGEIQIQVAEAKGAIGRLPPGKPTGLLPTRAENSNA